jgi:ligand-binding sensor domain-containing protein/signal transduction histidine kinase
MRAADQITSLARRAVTILALAGALINAARAEQLPLKLYTTADGLARDGINRIVRDSRGFLWFATREGLSRFDGYQFTNYTTQQGLPAGPINDVLETRNGRYWIATNDGVFLLNPQGLAQPRVTTAEEASREHAAQSGNDAAPMFVAYFPSPARPSRMVNVLREDRDGSIWCGTSYGVYRLKPANGRWDFQFVDMGMGEIADDHTLVEAMVLDADGSLWVGTGVGLYRRSSLNGRVEKYTTQNGLPGDFIQSLLLDSQKRIWVGTRYNGLCRLVSTIKPNQSIVENYYTTKDGLGNNWIAALFQSSEGTLWVGTTTGLSKFDAGSGKFTSFTTTNGLSDAEVWALTEDRDGSLWLGTANGGVMKLVQNGFLTYDVNDGLANAHVISIFEDRTGAIRVITSDSGKKFINAFDGKRFSSLWPQSFRAGGWGWNQTTFQDHTGEWWLDSADGVYRLPKIDRFEQLKQAPVKKHYTTKDGLGANDVFRLYEDSQGDVWISGISNGPAGLTRWERATETLHRYGPAEGIDDCPTAFRDDKKGNLWIGFYAGDKMARYAGGRFTFISETEGKPAGMIRALYLDSRNRLWIGSSRGGLARIDRTEDEHPQFVSYTTAEGLSSNDVWSITEDRWGRIYLGTGRGLDQLEPDTGHIRHYTAADGLARGQVEEAFRDRDGNLWFGTPEGLSRFVPQPEPQQEAPPILISGLRIAGATQRISTLGETEISSLVLDPQQKDLQIDFVGLDFLPGDITRYQYKLDGADKDWSAPSLQRSVSYANLSPGKYRFFVRAVNSAGIASQRPAVMSFTILPPIWQRWWFIALAAVAIGLIVYRIHHYRLAQLLALERVRTRIATDLHDDIGSSLSQVSVLSEVVHRRVKEDPAVAGTLTTIASLSRDLVDSMNDIVWAINPRRDHLSDLVQRMRRFASDVFTARDIEFTFRAPVRQQDLALGADLRRDVFLIFKEGVNNIVRHSQCTKAAIDFVISDGLLKLTLTDNGRGFDPQVAKEGNGMYTMNERAKGIGGSLAVVSNMSGTTITLKVPLGRTPWHWPHLRRHQNGESEGRSANGNSA